MLSTLYCSQPRVAMFTIFHAYHTTWDYHICIILKVWWHLTQESVEPQCSTYRSGVDIRCGFYSEIVNRVLMSWKHWCCWKYECCLSLWSRWMVQYQIGYFIVRKLKSSLFMAFALKRVWILKIFAKYEILEDFWKIPTPITQPGDLAGKHVVNLLSWPYYNFLVDPINPFHPIACHEDKNLQ